MRKFYFYKMIKKYCTVISILFMLSLFVIPVNSTNSLDIYNDELKITVTNIGELNIQQPSEFGRDSNLLPISINDIYQLMSINHVLEIIPIVNKINYNFTENFTGNFPRNYSHDDFPGDFNGTRPPGMGDRPNIDMNNMMQEMANYIIEGIPLNLYYSSNYILSNLEIKEGNNLVETDSSVVIIGEDAAEYYNVYPGANITIEGINLTVKGIIENNEYAKYIFMNITDAQIIYGFNQDEVNTLYIYVDDSSYLDDVSLDISNQFPTFRARYIGQQLEFPFDRNTDDNKADNEESFNNTPGFEFVLILFVICLIIIYKKNLRR